MTLVVTVTRSEPCFDPLQPFQEPEDKQALRLFKSGAVLHARRDSSLYGCWLEHQGTIHEFKPNSAVSGALQSLGQHSGTKLVTQEEGRAPDVPVELFVFAPEKLKTLSHRWGRAKTCASDWQRKQGAVSTDIAGLSEKALATLRVLKRQHALCMYPELFDVWLELNTRGFVAVNANGGVHLRPHPDKLKLPWGDLLKLKSSAAADVIASMEKTPVTSVPITLEVANPVACQDPLLRFGQGAGRNILDQFKAGFVLKVSRRATPNNWWLEHPDGRKHRFEKDIGTARALIPLSSQTGSSGVVSRAPAYVHNDAGKPLEETWAYCVHKFAIARLEWDSAKECADDWTANAGPFTADTTDLSELALATLRTIQQKYTIPMHPELFEVWLALNAKGYIDVFAEGYAQVSAAAREMFVVQGPRLELRYPPAPRR